MTHFVGDDCLGGHASDAPDPHTIDTSTGTARYPATSGGGATGKVPPPRPLLIDVEALEVGLMLAEVARRQPDAFVFLSHHDGLWWASYSATAGQAAGSKLVWDASLHAALTSLLKQLPEVPE